MAKHTPEPEMIDTLRELIRETFRLREGGAVYSKMARSLGYADGYMRALIDAGLAEEGELLHVVAEERTLANGPGSAEVTHDGTSLRGEASDHTRAVA